MTTPAIAEHPAIQSMRMDYEARIAELLREMKGVHTALNQRGDMLAEACQRCDAQASEIERLRGGERNTDIALAGSQSRIESLELAVRTLQSEKASLVNERTVLVGNLQGANEQLSRIDETLEQQVRQYGAREEELRRIIAERDSQLTGATVALNRAQSDIQIVKELLKVAINGIAFEEIRKLAAWCKS